MIWQKLRKEIYWSVTRWHFLDWGFREGHQWEERTLVARWNWSWGVWVEQSPKQRDLLRSQRGWTLNDKRTKPLKSGGAWTRCWGGPPGGGQECWLGVDRGIAGQHTVYSWSRWKTSSQPCDPGWDGMDSTCWEGPGGESPGCNSRRVMEEVDPHVGQGRMRASSHGSLF